MGFVIQNTPVLLYIRCSHLKLMTTIEYSHRQYYILL